MNLSEIFAIVERIMGAASDQQIDAALDDLRAAVTLTDEPDGPIVESTLAERKTG